ncbi:hypothetical protein PAECIP111802_02117 [Paenibacillus allorhizosphaerae]|uniref:Chromate transporter n=2 Tax=Paenibacillus allorhizosphaerae TaxID=2849866 RepID=A0ABM8VFI9_9BACL|nr:hypothetical protein PAECIP111802_02117 [Paenibacillus allorhizosphaerae]
MLWDLFLSFFKIGFMSFGGGYAMVPVIEHEVEAHAWLATDVFADTVSLAGMAPGPLATNMATLVGFKIAGLAGAVIATIGMVLPSLLVMIAIAAFFYKIHRNKWIRASFYGLRPIVTGLILFAAIRFGQLGMDEGIITWHTLISVLITGGVLVAVLKYNVPPIAAILLSGLLGIALF